MPNAIPNVSTALKLSKLSPPKHHNARQVANVVKKSL